MPKFNIDTCADTAMNFRELARNDYGTAFPLALQLAQSGNVSAEGLVGALYLSGNGTQQNLDQARYWLSKAAAAGDARSANNLGYIFSMERAFLRT